MPAWLVSGLRALPLLGVALQAPGLPVAHEGGAVVSLCRSDGTRIEVPFPVGDDEAPRPGGELHACHLLARTDREGRCQVKPPGA